MMPLAATQSCQATFEILVQIALDGTPGDARVEGDLVVGYTEALQPEHFHLLLDTGIGVVIPVAGQSPTVIRRKGDRAHDVTLHAVSRSLPVSSLCLSTAFYNSCQTQPRRVAPRLRHGGVHGRLVTANALGEPTQFRVQGCLASGQPFAQGPG